MGWGGKGRREGEARGISLGSVGRVSNNYGCVSAGLVGVRFGCVRAG